jgi:hypothetical protein
MDSKLACCQLDGGGEWQKIVLTPKDFLNLHGDALLSFDNTMRLKLSPSERLKPKCGSSKESRTVGSNWRGAKPKFRNLRWVAPASNNKSNR